MSGSTSSKALRTRGRHRPVLCPRHKRYTGSEFTYWALIGHSGSGAGLGGQCDRDHF